MQEVNCKVLYSESRTMAPANRFDRVYSTPPPPSASSLIRKKDEPQMDPLVSSTTVSPERSQDKLLRTAWWGGHPQNLRIICPKVHSTKKRLTTEERCGSLEIVVTAHFLQGILYSTTFICQFFIRYIAPVVVPKTPIFFTSADPLIRPPPQGLNHVLRKWSTPVEATANVLIPVPGGNDGPSGVLVCSEPGPHVPPPSHPPLSPSSNDLDLIVQRPEKGWASALAEIAS